MTLQDEYNYLFALKPGEFEELDNSAESHHAAYKRKFYSKMSSLIYIFNIKMGGKHFMIRTTDDNKLRIYRVSDGTTTVDLPELSMEAVREHALRNAQKALAESKVNRTLAREEKRLNQPRNQNIELSDHTAAVSEEVFARKLQGVLRKAGLLPEKGESGRSWFLVLVGDVPMGACNTLANAKQTAKLYKSAKVLEVAPL